MIKDYVHGVVIPLFLFLYAHFGVCDESQQIVNSGDERTLHFFFSS